MKSSKAIVSEVSALCEGVAQELGYTIWDVEYEKIGAEYHLTITIDSPNGIGIEDCEKMSRAIDPILDEADPIDEAYYLEVSSPGIERELRTDAHIEYCAGADVEVRLYAPINGSKVFRGELLPLGENGSVEILVGEQKLTFDRAAVAKIKTVFEF